MAARQPGLWLRRHRKSSSKRPSALRAEMRASPALNFAITAGQSWKTDVHIAAAWYNLAADFVRNAAIRSDENTKTGAKRLLFL